MAATAQEIINIAYSRSKRAQPGVDASDPELIVVLNEVISRYFTAGVEVNRDWFMTRAYVQWDEALQGWSRPAMAEMVYMIELADGTEVVRVPFDDRVKTEPMRPAVYRMRGTYHIARQSDPPYEGDRLTFYFGSRPQVVSVPEDEIDSRWPEGHETLLGLEIGIFLAEKDGRDGSGNTANDLGSLSTQRAASAEKFMRFLAHEDVGVIYRKGGRRKHRSGMIEGAS